MKYYSEEDVKDLYEWGCGKTNPPLENYPSIEIKTPHGRLIDADKLKKKMGDFFSTGSEVGYMWLVDEAPIVLEASKEEKK